MSASIGLGTPRLDDGVAHPAWWNGRLLTAEDLGELDDAVRGGDRALGRAVGDGVADGLVVSAADTRDAVVVTPGVAVAPSGEVLVLPSAGPVTVSLLRDRAATPGEVVGFAACTDVPAVRTATGSGAYLLTIASAVGERGQAAGVEGDDGRATTCGPRHRVVGVQFRLLEVDLEALASALGHDAHDVDVLRSVRTTDAHMRLRNVAAQVFLGGVQRRSALADALAGRATPDAVQELRTSGRLSACEVPLALVGWSRDGIAFVDGWALRRPRRATPATGLGAHLDDRAVDRGLASLQQFGDHMGDVLATDGAQLRARLRCRYLPAAVLVSTDAGGVPSAFLDGLEVTAGAELPAREVVPLLRRSLTAPPIDLDEDAVTSHRVTGAGVEAMLLTDLMVAQRPDVEGAFALEVVAVAMFGRPLGPFDEVRVGPKGVPVELRVRATGPATLVFRAAVSQSPYELLSVDPTGTRATLTSAGEMGFLTTVGRSSRDTPQSGRLASVIFDSYKAALVLSVTAVGLDGRTLDTVRTTRRIDVRAGR